ncbi:MAG: glycosyltransferase family 2 protein [Candidatus Daviesbacteria bacterium]|nr:glycosyltransferase family 2 protein [Candidatus Daviesbacteria bacterium]
MITKTNLKIIVVLISYNAEKTLADFYQELKKYYSGEIILVDDKSRDNTFELAKQLGIESYQNKVNQGYGGNLKRALYLALKKGADVIIDIHPDGEYKPASIPLAIKEAENGAKFILGDRFTNINKALESGMFIWKLIPLRTLNLIDNIFLGTRINDFHQGFRVYTKELLSELNFEDNSNKFIFSFQIIAQAIFNGIKITQVPVETKYEGEKRGATLKHSLSYTVDTFIILYKFILAKIGIKIDLFQIPKVTLEERLEKLDKLYENF